MMDWLQSHLPELAMSAAMAWGAGLRLYLVVFVVGMLGKFGYVPLPETLKILTQSDRPWRRQIYVVHRILRGQDPVAG